MMTRNLKILGTLLASALTMGALLAPTAVAEETIAAYFGASVGGEETAKIDGSQVETTTFTLGSQTVTCANASLNGQAVTAGEASTEIKLEPVFENCHATPLGVKRPATFTMNGCFYALNATVTFKEEGRQAENPADLKIECPAEKQIELHVYETESEEKTLCTYDIKSQSLSGVNSTNNETTPTSADDVVADINVTSVAVTNTKPSFLCGLSESMTASYKGASTLRATNAESEYVDFQSTTKKRFILRTNPGVVTGEKGTAEITTGKGPIKCTDVHYVGTTTSMYETDLTVEPWYSNCTAFGLTTHVYFEGCTYTFTQLPGTFGNGKEPGGHSQRPDAYKRPTAYRLP